MNDRAARRHYTHQGNRSLTEILALDDGASTLISTQHSAYQGEQFCCNGDPGTLENPVSVYILASGRSFDTVSKLITGLVEDPNE